MAVVSPARSGVRHQVGVRRAADSFHRRFPAPLAHGSPLAFGKWREWTRAVAFALVGIAVETTPRPLGNARGRAAGSRSRGSVPPAVPHAPPQESSVHRLRTHAPWSRNAASGMAGDPSPGGSGAAGPVRRVLLALVVAVAVVSIVAPATMAPPTAQAAASLGAARGRVPSMLAPEGPGLAGPPCGL